MKKIDNKAIIVLVSICAAVALLLAGVNLLTKPVIEAANAELVLQSLKTVMPDGEFNSTPDELKDGAPETVKAVYTEKNGLGHVVMLVTTKGYTGKEIAITVSVTSDGKIGKMVITKNEESIIPPGFEAMGNYGDVYQGASAEDIELITTATPVKFTKDAIKGALKDAFKYLGYAGEDKPEELYASDKELLELAEALAISDELIDITPDNADKTLKRMYQVIGNGYVVYLRTYAEYSGSPETDTLVHFDNNGKILAVKNLYWKVGHTVEQGAPDENAVNGFFAGYVGKNETDSVELVTGATGTALNFKNALDKAIDVVSSLGIVKKNALEISGEQQLDDVTPSEKNSLIKKIFYNKSSGVYVVYTVTIAQYGGGIETEGYTVIKDGKITKISLYKWTVGHTVEQGAPTQQRLLEFEKSFIGQTLEGIDGVELITGATTTARNFKDGVKAGLEAVSKIEGDNAFIGYGVLFGAAIILVMAVAVGTCIVYNKKIFTRGGKAKNERK